MTERFVQPAADRIAQSLPGLRGRTAAILAAAAALAAGVAAAPPSPLALWAALVLSATWLGVAALDRARPARVASTARERRPSPRPGMARGHDARWEERT